MLLKKQTIKILVLVVVIILVLAAIGIVYLYAQSTNKKNEEPVASIYANKRIVSVNETVQFSARDSFDNDGEIKKYRWDFGDGSFPAISIDISHEYTNPGEYTVVLTVYDEKNAKGQATITITVTSNIAPVASFLPDKYEYAKKEVATFNATSSFDPDGVIIHYYWEFGDGSFATGNITKHAYSQAGNYTVILTVTDDKNAKGFAFRNIIVHTNQAPIAKITASKTKVYAGEIIEFTSTGSEDADGTITSYSWEFGDGAKSTGSAAIHSYTRSGNFTVTLLVTDNSGATGFATCEISVLENSPPSAKIVCDGWLFDITETISFSAFGSSDAEGNISSYHWNFGDGYEDTSMNVSHRYSAIGVYNVVLTVYDEKGLSSQIAKRIGIIRSATPEMPYITLPFEIAVLNASEFMNMQVRIENVPVINNNSYALGYGLDPSAFVTFYVGLDGSEGSSQELSLMIYCERYATRPLWLNNSEIVDVQGIIINYLGTWEIKVRADSLDYAWKIGETPTTYPPTYTQVTVSELLANNQTYKNQRVVIYNAVVTDSYLYPIYGMNLSHYVKFNISDTITSTELMVYANTTHRPTFLENYDRVNIWGVFSSYYGSWQIKVTERYDKIERLGVDTPPNIDNVERDPYNVRPSQQVNITAHVIDDKRVSIVYLNYSVNNGAYHTLQMIPVNVDALGNGYYKCAIPAQAENSVVKYYIRAFDNASQQSSYPEDAPSTTISYTVATDTPPSFVSVSREPYNPYSNQDVTIFAKVTDDVKINSFQLFYSVNNGTYISISMTAVNVDAQMRGDYKGIIPHQNSGSYVKYYLRVTDDASHISYSPSNAPTSTYSYNVQSGNALNIYVANLHSHTQLSDGEGTPAEAYTYARDTANIDVLGVTDHTHMLTTTEWTSLKNAASTYTSNGNFVALYGQEFGSLNDFGHANIWECPSLCPVDTNDLSGFYSWVDSQNAMSGFNHPSPSYGTNFNNFAYSTNANDNMFAIELFNGKRESSYEAQYITALENGWHVGAIANQDNHNKKWGDDTTSEGRIYLTGVHAQALTKNDILDALKNKRTYAMTVSPSNDRIMLWFSANEQPMGSTISPGTVTIRAKVQAQTNFQRLSFYNGYTNSWSYKYISTNSYEWVMTVNAVAGSYFFLRAEQADGDYAYSSPIWVASSKGKMSASYEEKTENNQGIEIRAENDIKILENVNKKSINLPIFVKRCSYHDRIFASLSSHFGIYMNITSEQRTSGLSGLKYNK